MAFESWVVVEDIPSDDEDMVEGCDKLGVREDK